MTAPSSSPSLLSPAPSDVDFVGSIPQIYDQYLVPMIFEPYARDLAARIAAARPARVLEIAAGTGALTRHLAAMLGPQASIVATDLNPAMLEQARRKGTAHPVQWRQADVMSLPFADGAFDVVVCQFGVMFFPDRPAAHAQLRRVLRPGGQYFFNTWGTVADNAFTDETLRALRGLFPDDPPAFVERIPHGYHDRALIERDLALGGFDRAVTFETVDKRSLAPQPAAPAIGFCQGTPMRHEILARDPAGLVRVTAAVTEAIAARFGDGPIDGALRAHVVGTSR